MVHELKHAVFMHIQKTAGTSIQEMARELYGNDNVMSHADYENIGLDGCKPYRFVSGHFGFAFTEALMHNRFSFTFLRDPCERLISLYEFCLSRPPNEHVIYRAAHEGDFLNFLEPLHGDIHWATVWNNQAAQLYRGSGAQLVGLAAENAWDLDGRHLLSVATNNLHRFDYIGFQKTFSDDIELIFKSLGAARVIERKSNIGSRRVSYADLPVEAQRRLTDVTRIDWELYEQALERYPPEGKAHPFLRMKSRFRYIIRG